MSKEIREIDFNRPEPIQPKINPLWVDKKSDKREVAEWLISGKDVVIKDQFHTGMLVLSDLKKNLFGKKSKEDFKAYRETRTKYHLASNRLLVPIEANKIALKNSPEIGWLEILYPDVDNCLLTFPQVQGLNSSWQWYVKGIRYPGLKQKLHPFYGTYFPTRFDHLRLFWNWLKNYSGLKNVGLDIGTGCGVLAFQLLNRGFEMVHAVDINPNAVISVRENAKKLGVENQLSVYMSDLFEHCDTKADLIVFNPPWLPAQKDLEGLDSAIYYEPGLFERFFEQAEKYLNSDGKVILLFSNLARKTGVEKDHPVVEELAVHKRFVKQNLLKRKAEKSSRKTKRRDHRKEEFVELWELKRV